MDPNSGIGLFFRSGMSDGNPNPVKYAYNVGIGGKGIVPGRPNDMFGIGWSHAKYSDDFVPFLRDSLNLGQPIPTWAPINGAPGRPWGS